MFCLSIRQLDQFSAVADTVLALVTHSEQRLYFFTVTLHDVPFPGAHMTSAIDGQEPVTDQRFPCQIPQPRKPSLGVAGLISRGRVAQWSGLSVPW